jgi:glucose-1-phosphate cytidylyltransferase
MIKDYFRNYLWNTCDTTLTLGRQPEVEFHNRHDEEDWKVTLAETGEGSMTAYRVRQIQKYVQGDDAFLLTYGDGVGDINIPALLAHHRATRKVCTLTAVNPPGRFGELQLAADGLVRGFNEKPQAEGGKINGGFMVCDPRIFDYLPDDPGVMLEHAPAKRLTAEGQLSAYCHQGFWQPMDTFQEAQYLNRLWDAGQAPWKIW